MGISIPMFDQSVYCICRLLGNFKVAWITKNRWTTPVIDGREMQYDNMNLLRKANPKRTMIWESKMPKWRDVRFAPEKGRCRAIKHPETFGLTMSLRPCQKGCTQNAWRIAIDRRRQTFQVKAKGCLVIMCCPRVLLSSILRHCVVFFNCSK